MSLKTEKLVQRMAEIQDYVAARLDQDVTYGSVLKELDKISESLKDGKLVLTIASADQVFPTLLQGFLSAQKALPELYTFVTAGLPSPNGDESADSAAALTILNPLATPSGQTRFALPRNRTVAVGRDSTRSQLLISNGMTFVSGCHAEIQPIPCNAYNAREGWQICDLQSRNGTFVNGERVTGCHDLKPGDRIVLGGPSPGDERPQFIVEWKVDHSATDDGAYRRIVDCDVLCLIVAATEPVAGVHRRVIEAAGRAEVARIVVVVDVPALDPEWVVRARETAERVRTMFQGESSSAAVEMAVLPLRALYSNVPIAGDAGLTQDEIGGFVASLESMSKRKPEDILAKRITARILAQVATLERVLDAQDEALKREATREEQALRGVGLDELKEQMKNLVKQANDDRERFAKQARLDITQSKVSLLDGFNKKSIFSKIQVFTDELKPVFTRRGAHRYIQLQPHEAQRCNVDIALHRFVRNELIAWANDEWDRVCTQYADGGLHALFQRTYRTLNVSPGLHLLDSLAIRSDRPDLTRTLQDSIMGIPCEILYKEESLGAHVFKNIRSTMMTITLALGIVLNFAPLMGGKNPPQRPSLPQIDGTSVAIYGEVADPLNDAVKEATIQLFRKDAKGETGPAATVAATDRGNYVLSATLPEGTYTVKATAPDYSDYTSKDGVLLTPGSPKQFDIQLKPSSSLSGMKAFVYWMNVAKAGLGGWGNWIFVSIVLLFLGYLVWDYFQNKKLKISELKEKLRKDLSTYFQSYVKDRIDKLIGDIVVTLEAEENRLKATVDKIGDQLGSQMSNIKKRLDDCKLRQGNVAKERMALEKFKRI